MKIAGIIILVVIVLKIIGVINWSWWSILLPIWGPLVIEILWVCGCRMLDWLLKDKEGAE